MIPHIVELWIKIKQLPTVRYRTWNLMVYTSPKMIVVYHRLNGTVKILNNLIVSKVVKKTPFLTLLSRHFLS